MITISLYGDTRPKLFKEVKGNAATKKALIEIIKRPQEKRPHTFLFQGSSGCGKTTLARILAKKLGCTEYGLLELDAAKKRDVETMRGIVADAQFKPMDGDSRVFIIDEAHELPRLAQETLLKTTEDTPLTTYFIFCTTEPGKIIKTLMNRCTAFSVEALRDDQMESLLSDILGGVLGSNVTNKAIDKIIEIADGSPRKALVILDKVYMQKDEEIQLQLIESFNPESGIFQICDGFYRGMSWKEIIKIYQSLPERDPEGLRRAVLGYMKNRILKGGKNAAVAFSVINIFEQPVYDSGEAGLLARMYEADLALKSLLRKG